MNPLALLFLSSILAGCANGQGSNAQDERLLIIGGTEAVVGRYPYAVLLRNSRVSDFRCGGSLIARDVVLSAAHCTAAVDYVGVGKHDVEDDDGEYLEVKEIVPHPNFSPMLLNRFGVSDNDFMLLFLERPSSADDVATVKLNRDPAMPSMGQNVTVMGWGDTDIRPGDYYQATSDELMNVDVNAISNDECEASAGTVDSGATYNGRITANMLCARADGKDSCQGDSGGPLVIKGVDAASDVQVGVVSWGFGCAIDQFPGVYARVSQAYDWIQSEVCKGSDYASDAGFDCSAIDWSFFTNPVVDNPCIICPDGTTVDGGDDFQPYATEDCDGWWDCITDFGASLFGFGDFRTCSKLIEAAEQYETGTEWCGLHEMHEAYCCPTVPLNPCALCPNGITSGDDFVPEYEGNNSTCKELIDYAKRHETDSDYCGYIGKNVESYCCFNPCTICPNGATVDGGDDFKPYAITDEDNVTCGELIVVAKSYETESYVCGLHEVHEINCCPTAPVNPCIMCPSGVGMRANFVPHPFTGSTMDCTGMKDFATKFESESQFCKWTKAEDESLCCPPPPSPEPVSGGARAFRLVERFLAFTFGTTFTIALCG